MKARSMEVRLGDTPNLNWLIRFVGPSGQTVDSIRAYNCSKAKASEVARTHAARRPDHLDDYQITPMAN